MIVQSQEWIASEPKWILFACMRKYFLKKPPLSKCLMLKEVV